MIFSSFRRSWRIPAAGVSPGLLNGNETQFWHRVSWWELLLALEPVFRFRMPWPWWTKPQVFLDDLPGHLALVEPNIHHCYFQMVSINYNTAFSPSTCLEYLYIFKRYRIKAQSWPGSAPTMQLLTNQKDDRLSMCPLWYLLIGTKTSRESSVQSQTRCQAQREWWSMWTRYPDDAYI